MAISNNSTGLRPGVCTSTTRPTAPYEGQHIYETDTDLVYLWNGTAWVETVSALTKAPRGVMGSVVRTAGNLTINTAYSDLTSMSITFTAVAGRLYRASWGVGALKETAAGYTQVTFTNSANDEYGYSIMYTVGGGYINLSGVAIISGLTAGSKTFKLRGITENNTATIIANSDAQAQLIIEDVGAA